MDSIVILGFNTNKYILYGITNLSLFTLLGSILSGMAYFLGEKNPDNFLLLGFSIGIGFFIISLIVAGYYQIKISNE